MSGVLSSARVRVNMGKVPWIFNSKALVLIAKSGMITIISVVLSNFFNIVCFFF